MSGAEQHQPSASLQDKVQAKKGNTDVLGEQGTQNLPDLCQTEDQKLCTAMKQQVNIEAKQDKETQDLEVDADAISDSENEPKEESLEEESRIKEGEKMGTSIEQEVVQQEVGDDVKTESDGQDLERQSEEQSDEEAVQDEHVQQHPEPELQEDDVNRNEPTQEANVHAEQQEQNEQQQQTENVVPVDQQQQVHQTPDPHSNQSQPVQEEHQEVEQIPVQDSSGHAEQRPQQQQQQEQQPQQQEEQQQQFPSQNKEQKTKKKKPFYRRVPSLNKLGKSKKSKKGKSKKDKYTECESSHQRTPEKAASVEFDDDDGDDIAKVHFEGEVSSSQESSSLSSTGNTLTESGQNRSQSFEDESRGGVQEHSANKDDQLVTGASCSSPQGRASEASKRQPKLKAPRLDTSSSVPVTKKAPVRHSPTSYHPTEQFYDVLMIHSDTDEDWKEVDYIKAIGKKHRWKMISVEEFPAGMTKFEIFSTMLSRCSYTMLLLTKHFFGDVWCNHRYAACLTAAIENREHQWSVIPVLYNDSGYETPLELTTIAGLQREARYFHRNLRSSISNRKRKEREEAEGFPTEPSPPPSPSPPVSPMPVQPQPQVARPNVQEHTSQMSAGELYRYLKPELAPTEPVVKFFRDDDRFRKICELLDVEHSLGRDYRLLAQMVGFDAGETRSLAKEKSPTARILEVFCIKNEAKAKLEVLETFKRMVMELDQQEVKSLVENEIMVAKFAN